MYLGTCTIAEQTYLIHKFIKFRGCLEAASESTNVPDSSEPTWTLFHHPQYLTNKSLTTQICDRKKNCVKLFYVWQPLKHVC